ncbi:MAG: metal ABC transporter substrate-binding protein [Pseudonocardiaceae bacterium]|nr:metal ABC transporter substrate-binding protein [Pseudonocardiaceae bacterium]
MIVRTTRSAGSAAVRLRKTTLATAGLASVALVASGCGGSESVSDEPAKGQISVAASTNVWGSVTKAIGGDQVAVESIIDDPSVDPHSYEDTPADAAAVTDAQLLVYNGGGYDEFFTKLADRAGNTKQVVAFDLSGKAEGEQGGHGEGEHGHAEGEHGHAEGEQGHAEGEHGHAEGEHGHAEGEQGHAEGEHGHEHGAVNEHVWYDLPTVQKVADRVATDLGKLKPESKATFQKNADRFHDRIDELIGRTERINKAKHGSKVLATEPVSHYLVEAAGLNDVTPDKYVESIENEADVPPVTVAEVNKLVSGKQVDVVLDNTQTETPTTTDIVRRAKNSGIPVVQVTETLAEGTNGYVDWMGKQVNALSRALGV